MGSNRQVNNIGLVNANVQGLNYVGILAGYNNIGNNVGTISACHITGTASGIFYVGGLVGHNSGTISSCYTATNVSGSSYVGGFVGQNYINIISCYAMGSVTATGTNIGGLVGHNYYGVITSCVAAGDVIGGGSVGGLAGQNYGRILFCNAIATVSGSSVAGGLVGENRGTIDSSYATGSVNSQETVCGGLVGNNYQGKVIRSYSTGKPTGTLNVGGFCGAVDTGGNYEDTGNYWDMDTSEITTSVMGTGKTTTEMKTLATFAGWDFGDTWAICEGTNYPRLQWQIPAGDWVCPDGVAMEDFAFLAGHWMETTSEADLSGDGVVDMADLVMFGEHWMAGI
jgi:hypothetical protein